MSFYREGVLHHDLGQPLEPPEHEVHRGRSAGMTDIVTCGTCGRTWDDSIITAVTPAPSGRCPFEDEHDAPVERRKLLTVEQEDALAGVLDLGWDTLSDLGPQMTCSEVETVAAMYAAFGDQLRAEALLEGHAYEDDEGDMHYMGDNEGASAWRPTWRPPS